MVLSSFGGGRPGGPGAGGMGGANGGAANAGRGVFKISGMPIPGMPY